MIDWTLGGKLDVAISGLFGTSLQASYQAGTEVTSPTSTIAVPTDYELEIVSNTLIFQGDTVHVQFATTIDTAYNPTYLRVRGLNICTDNERVDIYTDYDFDTNVCTYAQYQWYDAWNFGGSAFDSAIRMSLKFGATSSTIRTWTAREAEMDFGVSPENYVARFTVPWSSWPSTGGVIPTPPLYVAGNYENSGDNPVIVTTINNLYSEKANSTTLIFPDFAEQTTYNEQVSYITNYAADNYPDLLPDILAAIPIFDDIVGFQYQPNNYFDFAIDKQNQSSGNMTAEKLYDVLTTETYDIPEIDTELPTLETWEEPTLSTEYNNIIVDTFNTGYDMLESVGIGTVISSTAIFAVILAILRG